MRKRTCFSVAASVIIAAIGGVGWSLSYDDQTVHHWMLESSKKEVLLLELRHGRALLAFNNITLNANLPPHLSVNRIVGPYRYS